MNLWHLGAGLLIFAVLGLAVLCIAKGLSKSNAELDEQQQQQPRTYGPTSQSPNFERYTRVDSPAPRKPAANRPSSSSSADTTPVVSSYPYSPAISGTEPSFDSSPRKEIENDSSTSAIIGSSNTSPETPASQNHGSDNNQPESSSDNGNGGSDSSSSSSSGDGGSSSSGGE